jgi:hypothetical protein
MIGEATESYVKNISTHHAYARFVAIHATSFLTVEDNVAYYCKGHNIFLADGVETNNTIRGNLIVSPRASHTMYQSDVRAAGIYVSHPNNVIENNHVAGSEFNGFTY